MRYTVSILRRARADIDEFRAWIARLSPQGAAAWYRAHREAVKKLRRDAHQQGQAPESAELGRDIRQTFFKTRRGRPYRLIYTIIGNEVRILRVRGPGQAPVTAEDISE
jgi:plasmid stabilization system protein ParE